jgi:putative ABC transport system ATP-binding protein
MMPIIRVSDIRKVYKNDSVETVALDGVSFDVKKGEFLAIMGPSGSGKSTLMHILGALDKPTSGKYFLDGKEISSLNEDQLAEIRNKRIGFVFQAFNLLPRTTALKNVVLPMVYGGVKKEERLEKARQLLEMVGLADRIDYTPSQLSGGQQQRVAIARSLTMDPALILADEPTGNIATNQAQEIMNIFVDLHKRGHTIVMITHEEDIASYAERVIYLRDGKIIKDTKSRKISKKLV